MSLNASPDHLLVLVQSLLGHVLDEGRVLRLQLPGDGEDERGRVQDVDLHLGVRDGRVLPIEGLWCHLESRRSIVRFNPAVLFVINHLDNMNQSRERFLH